MKTRDAVAYIDIRVFSHATENEAKVMEAARKVVPTSCVDVVAFEKHVLSGHHGNPIVFLETRVKDKDTVKAIVEKIAATLNTLDKEALCRRLEEFTQKGSLYIRLDKQAAFLGELKLGQVDPIRIHMRFKRKDVTETCRELGLIL